MSTESSRTYHAVAPTRLSRRERLDQSRLYVCTGARPTSGDLAEFAREALEGGVDLIQVRDKELEARREVEALLEVRRVAQSFGALLAVNDRADIAALVGADVLHVGQGDLTTAQARRIVGDEMLIGRSTHSEHQLVEADSDPGLDYFCVGPVWETPTKPGRSAVGVELVRFAARHATKPWFAIGGLDSHSRVREVVSAGARRIAVVRAVQDDPREGAAGLVCLLHRNRSGSPSDRS